MPSFRPNREKLLGIWLRSKSFRRTGIDASEMAAKIRQECRSGGDLLRITLGELARRQGVSRWAVHDCDNIMHIPKIKRELPDALFVHVVRDGRDAALSMMRQHHSHPKWWLGRRPLPVWATLWAWTVRKGRHHAQMFPADYIEVRYEDLVSRPKQTLRTLGEFLDHDLDYGRIKTTGIGRVSTPNTVWTEESGGQPFSPVNRWKTKLTLEEVDELEALIGDCLGEFNYSLATRERAHSHLSARYRMMRVLYPVFFDIKLFLRAKTLVGRWAKGTRLELTSQPTAS